jgi:hypothetical protein
MRTHYPPQAVLLYVALGIAIGMVAWALLLHDGGKANRAGGPAAPALRQGNGR